MTNISEAISFVLCPRIKGTGLKRYRQNQVVKCIWRMHMAWRGGKGLNSRKYLGKWINKFNLSGFSDKINVTGFFLIYLLLIEGWLLYRIVLVSTILPVISPQRPEPFLNSHPIPICVSRVKLCKLTNYSQQLPLLLRSILQH